MAEALDLGVIPEGDILQPLTAFIAAMHAAEDQLSQWDAVPTERSASAFTQALYEVGRRLTARKDERDSLRLLLDLRADSAEELSELRAAVTALLEAGNWSEEEREQASGLRALGEFVDHLETADPAAPPDRSTLKSLREGTRGLPPELAHLPAMAMTRELSWGGRTPEAAETLQEETASVGLEPPAPLPLVPDKKPAETRPAVSVTELDIPQPRPEKAVWSPETQRLAELISERRFAAALAMATALGRPEHEQWSLRVAALTDAVRSGDGPCAIRLTEEFASVTGVEPEQLPLLVAAPALIRAALVTGSPSPGALLIETVRHLDPDLGLIAEAVGRRAVRSTLVPLVDVLADVTDLEQRVAAAGADAREKRIRPRRLSFPRATEMTRIWLDPGEGILGRLLSIAERDDRTRRVWAMSEVKRLSASKEIVKEINSLDQSLRYNAANPLQGGPRQKLRSMATGALEAVSVWSEAVVALERQAEQVETWVRDDINAMRAELLGHRDAVLATLRQRSEQSDPLVSAAARAAGTSLESTFALLSGQEKLRPGEPPADFVLTVESLKTPGARIDAETGLVSAESSLSPEALGEAFDLSWSAAFDAHTGSENYPAAATILSLVSKGELTDGPLPDLGVAEMVLAEAVSRSKADLAQLRESLRLDLRRARGQNELSEDQETRLAGVLNEADPTGERSDLDEIRSQLREITDSLPGYRKAAADGLRERLDRLMAENRHPRDDRKKLDELIDQGKLSIAEELLYCLEINTPMPEWEPKRDLEAFFPTVPDALPTGIGASVAASVRTGGRIAGLAVLDFAESGESERARAADVLAVWTDLATAPPEQRGRGIPLDGLRGILRQVGLEAKQVERSKLTSATRDRRFVEVSGVKVVDKATVPAFGTRLGAHSESGGRLRILLVWGNPAAQLLMSWIDQDHSGDPLLVIHFGTMRPAVRKDFAIRAVASRTPVIVLDDAAMVYLAAHGGGQFDTTLAITLPFSSVNPYLREKRGEVATEMFFGRDRERSDIIDPDKTQVIYGGRGLGKSALLRAAKTRFEIPDVRKAIYVDLKETVGKGGLAADAVWDLLRRELIDQEVLALPKQKESLGDARSVVPDGVRAWLKADDQRKLLILLDEADGFFESDTPYFNETNRLRALGADTNGRVKVVFAGLHSVQRFSKIGVNGPFQQLALRPAAIGPLAHQNAFELVVAPLRALGMVFLDDDLVHRINGFCAYQPFLLQMFGHRLVELMQQRRVHERSSPPYVITADDVNDVESDTGLRGDIHQVFRDTLNLDPRYNVIANVLAHQAHERGIGARLSTLELNGECRHYWPEGFELDVEVFRTYLNEMVGLGVLAAQDGLGWQLRSVNVLPMIGSADDVMTELATDKPRVPHHDHMLEARRALNDGVTRSPLTVAQLDDLLGNHTTQVRVVLGSRATGVQNVAETVRTMVDDLAYRYRLIVPPTRRDFDNALTEGIQGERRVVLSDFVRKGMQPDNYGDSLTAALKHGPQRSGVTRSVIMVSDPGNLPFWEQALSEEDTRFAVVTLRRYTPATLQSWTLSAERFSGRLDQLLEATSGWPCLVERARALREQHGSEEAALARLTVGLTDAKAVEAFIRDTGLLVDSRLTRIFEDLAAIGDNLTRAELVEAAALSEMHPDPELAIRCLLTMQVLDKDSAGRHRTDPLLTRLLRQHLTPAGREL